MTTTSINQMSERDSAKNCRGPQLFARPMETNEDIIQDEEALLSQIGLTLILLQDLEDALSHCTKMVFGDSKIITLEDLLSDDKRPLGQLITALKTAVDLNPDFDKLLKEMLNNRNLFVHRLRNQPWFNLHTYDGRKKAWMFLHDFYYQIEEVIMVFHAVAFRQAKELKMPETEEEKILRQRGFMQTIEKEYIPFIDRLIKKKG
jgi:hypothetical protein